MLKEYRPICLSPAETDGINFTKISSFLFCVSLKHLLLLFLLVLCKQSHSPKRTETSGKACREVRMRPLGEERGHGKCPFPLVHMQIWARPHAARSGTARTPWCRISAQRSSVLCAWWKAWEAVGTSAGSRSRDWCWAGRQLSQAVPVKPLWVSWLCRLPSDLSKPARSSLPQKHFWKSLQVQLQYVRQSLCNFRAWARSQVELS